MVDEAEIEPGLDTISHAMRITSRHGTADCDFEDRAAAMVALSQVLTEEADARHDAERGTDLWQQSARGLRQPLQPGPGAWRGFSG